MMSILIGNEEFQTWTSEVWAGYESVILTIDFQKVSDYQGFFVPLSP